MNSFGRREAAVAAGRFARLGIVPDRVLISPARRTRETGAIFCKKLKLPAGCVRVEPEIYEAERAQLLRIVQRQDDAHDVLMVIGHNPGVSLLLNHLVDGGVEVFPPGAFAVVKLSANRWAELSFKSLTLMHYDAPDVSPAWWHKLAPRPR